MLKTKFDTISLMIFSLSLHRIAGTVDERLMKRAVDVMSQDIVVLSVSTRIGKITTKCAVLDSLRLSQPLLEIR